MTALPVSIEYGQGKGIREWRPFPHQERFLEAQEDEVFFGGAPGPGKSEVLLIYLFMRCVTIPGHRGLYLRREFPMLERTVIPRSMQLFYGTGARYNATKHFWYFPHKDGPGSVLEFGHMYEKHDMYAYQGAEYESICFDELTEFEEEMFEFMLSRLRTTKPGVRTQVRAASNPLGIGHQWVKARFVDPAPEGGAWEREFEIPRVGTIRRSFRYIPCTVFDNPIIVRENPQYIAQIDSLPEPRRTAYLKGDWNVYEGAFFAEFNAEQHVVEPFDISGMPVVCTMDWGFAKPYAIYWAAVDADENLYIVDELYGWGGKPDVGSRESAAEVAQKVRELETQRGYQVVQRVADPAIWQRSGHTGPSIGEEFMQAGLIFERADNDRVQGWNQMHMRIKHGRLKVFARRCPHLLRTLPSLPPSPSNPEDLDTKTEDHAADSIRYLCMSRPMGPEPVARSPKPLPFALQDDEPVRTGYLEW